MTVDAAQIKANAPKDATEELVAWVTEVAELTKPEAVYWCDGSEEERDRFYDQMVKAGTFIKLNEEKRPGSYYAKSDPSDVARVESRTYICCDKEEDAGPTNNWADPKEMRETLKKLYDGCMRGRTMYVIPFSMGPLGGAISQLGVELTDSEYVVVSMRIMTRMGAEALKLIAEGKPWVKAQHTVGYPLVDADGNKRDDVAWPCNPDKYITHFPQDREIISYGSGYGGNALLGKKCYALRIASGMGREEGWMAEHMLILKITREADNKEFYLTAAFPSACGKTNLAMLRPTIPGYKIETIGDDIAWMRPGPDGRLYAINPENGFFGVAPGTGENTNPTALHSVDHDTIFTNVALTPDGDIWWEGMTDEKPAELTDWKGRPWTPESPEPAAHPNSRFTVRADQAATIAPNWEDPAGVPVDIILFGGRRASNVPLISEAYDWNHGVFVGATVSSEQTAAAEGSVGALRRDPFAMLPFCGYNMADYWAHWLRVGQSLANPPRIFQVNWFRKAADGHWLWPGFGDNSRPIEWALRRVAGEVGAIAAISGRLPRPEDLNLDGLRIPADDLAELFTVDPDAWAAEAELTQDYFAQFGAKVPAELDDQLAQLRERIARVKAAG